MVMDKQITKLTVTKMMKKYLLTWLILNNTLLCCVCEYGSFDDMDRLHKNLTQNYNRNIRPVRNQSDVVVVDIEFHVASIQGLDERAQVFSSTIGLLTYWTDENLRWDPQDYGGAELLTFQLKDIWVPDISLQNAIDNGWAQFQADQSSRVTVNSSGRAIWTMGGNINTACDIDIRKYPFDKQTCIIELGKQYSYDSYLMLKATTETININAFRKNGEWDIASTRTYSLQLPGIQDYTRLAMELTLVRKPLFYLLNILLPVLSLSFLNIVSFKLPANSGERIGYCVSLYLTFAILLTAVGDSMPKVSDKISYLQMYVYLQLSMSSSITVISVYLVHVSRRQSKSIPLILRPILSIIRCKVNCRSFGPFKQETEEIQDHSEGNEDVSDTAAKDGEITDWENIAMEVDKVLFWIFLSLYITVSIAVIGLMIWI